MRESDRNRFPAKQQTFRAVRSGNCTGFHSSLESREQLASILPGRVHVKCLIPRRNAAKGLGSVQEKQQQQRGKGILERSNDTFYRLTLRRAEDSPIFFPFLIPADFCVSRAALSRFSIKRDGGSALVESYRSHTGVGSKRKKEGEGRERWKMAIKSSILYAKRARVCVCVGTSDEFQRWIRRYARESGIWVSEIEISFLSRVSLWFERFWWHLVIFRGELLERRWKSNILVIFKISLLSLWNASRSLANLECRQNIWLLHSTIIPRFDQEGRWKRYWNYIDWLIIGFKWYAFERETMLFN